MLFNFTNQLGAGPKNITNKFCKYLLEHDIQCTILLPNIEIFDIIKSSGRVKVHKVPAPEITIFRLIIRFFFLAYFNIFYRGNVLEFGNYSMFPFNKGCVLVHHPYLYDDLALMRLPFKNQILERFKQSVFYVSSIKGRKTLVTQSNIIKIALEKKYGAKSIVIPNPIMISSHHFIERSFILNNKKSEFLLIYASRYYPHKCHQEAIEIVERLQPIFKTRLILTVDENKIPDGLKSLMNKPFITNLGEVAQEKLIDLYVSSDLALFPSSTETYGNTIAEKMSFSLPIIIKKASYANAFFKDDELAKCSFSDAEEGATVIEYLLRNPSELVSMAKENYVKSSMFLSIENWTEKYLEIVKDL
jgi:glycosyltransferase involved in cell wall biosynthesis